MKKLIRSIAAVLTFSVVLQSTAFALPAERSDATAVETAIHTYDTTEIIVKYEDKTDTTKQNAIRKNAKKKGNLRKINFKRKLTSDNAEVVEVANTEEVDSALDALQSMEGVEYAAPNYKLKAQAVSKDLMDKQWALDAAKSKINIVSAWNTAKGNGQLIGVMDTGIDISHPDLQDAIYTNTADQNDNRQDDDQNGYIDDIHGWDFIHQDASIFDSAQEDTHGTQVAGIIAATAPGAKLLPLKVLSGNEGTTADAIEAIAYAKKMGVKIMNLSFGCEEYNYALKDTMAKSNMLFICAGGNQEIGANSKTYPAAFGLPNIIAVGACDEKGAAATFTQSGVAHDVFAPGVDVYTTTPDSSYANATGTSFACAYVSGIAAMIGQAVPELKPELIALSIKNGYTQADKDSIKIADANKAVECALPYKYLGDRPGLLSGIVARDSIMLTSSVAKVFTLHTNWSQLNNDEKSTVVDFFQTPAERIQALSSCGLPLTDAIALACISQQASWSIEQAISFYNLHKDEKTCYQEMDTYASLIRDTELNASEQDAIRTLLLQGFFMDEIVPAFVAAKSMGQPVTNIIGTGENIAQAAAGEEDGVVQFSQKYHVRTDSITQYITDHNITIDALMDTVTQWQKDNRFLLADGTLTSLSASALERPMFNRYKVSDGNTIAIGNGLAFDPTDGMVSYASSLINLKGRGGFDLNLALRFDPEVAELSSTAKDPSNVSYQYKVYQTTVYDWDDGHQTTSESTIDIDASQLDTYKNEDGKTYNFSSGTYTKHIKISAGTTDTGSSATAVNNFYATRYGMGVGWSLSLPSVEIIGNSMYLHTSSGRKYRLINKGNGTGYTLEGYLLSDLMFNVAESSAFSSNGLSSAYFLKNRDMSYDYFDATGKYIGSKDVHGNIIRAEYNGDRLTKLIDSANRYVCFITSPYGDGGKRVMIRTGQVGVQRPDKLIGNLNLSVINGTNALQLTEIIDAAGRSTKLSYSIRNNSVSINDRSMFAASNPAIAVQGLAITSCTLPTGQKQAVNYGTAKKTYGPAGTKTYPRIASTYMSTDTGSETLNTKIFSYTLQTGGTAVSNTYWMFADKTIYPYQNNTMRVKVAAPGTQSENYEYYLVDRYNYMSEKGLCYTSNDEVYRRSVIDSRNAYGLPTSSTDYSIGILRDAMVTRKEQTWNSYGSVMYERTSIGTMDDGTYHWESYPLSMATYAYGPNSRIIPTLTKSYKYKKDMETDAAIECVANSINSNGDVYLTKTYYTTQSGVNTDMNQVSFGIGSYGQINSQTVRDLTVSPAEDITTTYTYDSDFGVYVIATTDKNIIDADGNSTDITRRSTYDLVGNQLTSTDPNGNTTTYTYDNIGRQLTVTDPTGAVTSTAYSDANGGSITTTEPNGMKSRQTYNKFGQLVSESSTNNEGDMIVNTEYFYDSQMRQYRVKNYLTDDHTKYNYTETSSFDKQDRPLNSIFYDQDGNRLAIRTFYYLTAMSFQGSEELYDIYQEFTKDADGHNLSYTKTAKDAAGRTHIECQSVDGDIVKTYYKTYGPYGLLFSTSGDTETVNIVYDEFGRQVSTEVGGQSTGERTYNGLYYVTKEKDANGYETTYSYDRLGRLVNVKKPVYASSSNPSTVTYFSNTKTYYDGNGNVTKIKKQNNMPGSSESYTTTEYGYNSINQLIMSRTVGDSQHDNVMAQHYYDKDGRLRRTYTGLHAPIIINGLDDVTAVMDNDFATTKYEYYADGMLKETTDPMGNKESYEYDDAGRMIKKTLSDGKSVVYEYDAKGNVVKTTAGTVVRQYLYDMRNDLYRIIDENGTTDYTYYDDHSLKSETRNTTGKISYTIDYEYESDKLKSYDLKDISTRSVDRYKQSFYYDAQGRIEHVANSIMAVYYQYDSNGNMTQRKTNDYTQNFAYNPGNMLIQTTTLKDGDSDSQKWYESYNYKLDGNLDNKSSGGGSMPTESTTYQYDRFDRLIGERYSKNGLLARTDAYTYDDYNNRLSKTSTVPATATTTAETYTYDKNSRMLTRNTKVNGDVSGNDTYSYDNAGNLIQIKDKDNRVTTSYSYNNYNKLASMTTSGQTYSFGYDGLNQRIYSAQSGMRQDHIWAGDNIIYDSSFLTGMGAVVQTRKYFFGNGYDGMMSYSVTSNIAQSYFAIKNNRGDVIRLADTSFQATLDDAKQTRTYDAYGNNVGLAAFDSAYQYAGAYYDIYSKMYLMGARDYDPATGQFTQADTFKGSPEQPFSYNAYGYCWGNPVRYVDPSGNMPESFVRYGGYHNLAEAEASYNLYYHSTGGCGMTQ